MPADQAFPFAAVILAGGAAGGDGDRVAAMVQAARAAGAHGIVVAVPRGWRAPAHARVVHVAPGASPISAVRAGMAQLSNTPAPLRRARPALAAFDGADLERGPVMIARDAWLELMTLGERGLAAVAERRGVRRVQG